MIRAKRILVAGKGGSGKSTIVAVISTLASEKVDQVIVVDVGFLDMIVINMSKSHYLVMT